MTAAQLVCCISFRQGSAGGDALGDALASKEPSSLFNKLRPSHSERELPSLIPSHPEGGQGGLTHSFLGSRSFSTGTASHLASAAMSAVGLGGKAHAAEPGTALQLHHLLHAACASASIAYILHMQQVS